MSSDAAIKVDSLSKCYHVYATPRDRLLQMIARGKQQYYREFWAVKDVSFEVKQGETVGIVGRNGSGKSTLLQMICGTLNPTGGFIHTNGRISALLELGSGFNPEFTGRENVYMNAAVLGLTKEETDSRFGDIADFAEIGKFIEQPVKTYSSGMVVRLAFAVAINVDAKILVVDEALSVGDELFQRKCFSRIEAMRSNGATILFVSHSGGAIVELCDRAMLMDGGELLASGAPKKIIGRYQKLLYVPVEKREEVREQIRCTSDDAFERSAVGKDATDAAIASYPSPVDELEENFDPNLKPSSTVTYESYGAYIESPRLLAEDSRQVNNLIRGKTYRYQYQVAFKKFATNVRFGMMIKTTTGVELGGGTSAVSAKERLAFVERGTVVNVEFTFRCSLNPGIYFLNAGVMGDIDGSEVFLHRIVDVAMFRVLSETDSLATGLVDFNCMPEVEIKRESVVANGA